MPGVSIKVLGTQDTAFAVESGRYCAIGPRHGADLLLRYKHLVKAGHASDKRRKQCSRAASLVRDTDTRHSPKVSMFLGGGVGWRVGE